MWEPNSLSQIANKRHRLTDACVCGFMIGKNSVKTLSQSSIDRGDALVSALPKWYHSNTVHKSIHSASTYIRPSRAFHSLRQALGGVIWWRPRSDPSHDCRWNLMLAVITTITTPRNYTRWMPDEVIALSTGSVALGPVILSSHHLITLPCFVVVSQPVVKQIGSEQLTTFVRRTKCGQAAF